MYNCKLALVDADFLLTRKRSRFHLRSCPLRRELVNQVSYIVLFILIRLIFVAAALFIELFKLDRLLIHAADSSIKVCPEEYVKSHTNAYW